MIDDQRSLHEFYNTKILSEAIPEFLNKMETLETWVINSEDFLKELHRSGISMGNIPDLYLKTSFPYLRRIFVS